MKKIISLILCVFLMAACTDRENTRAGGEGISRNLEIWSEPQESLVLQVEEIGEPVEITEQEKEEEIETEEMEGLTSANVRFQYIIGNKKLKRYFSEKFPTLEFFEFNESGERKYYRHYFGSFDSINHLFFTTEVTVRDFRFLKIQVNDNYFNQDGSINEGESRYIILGINCFLDEFTLEAPIILTGADLGSVNPVTAISFTEENGETRYFSLHLGMADFEPPVYAVEFTEPEYFKTLTISEELIEQKAEFFRSLLRAFIENDEETIKAGLSERLYNEYLESLVGGASWDREDILWLESIVEDRLIGWWIHNSHLPGMHEPGITFFTRLMRQSDVDQNNDIGMKYLVNIS